MLVIERSAHGKGAPLRRAKVEASARIVAITSDIRRAFVSPIVGQELTYAEKEKQAVAYLALTVEPDPADPVALDAFGFIFGEVGITGQNPYQVAQVIAHQAALMRWFGPVIERMRLQAVSDLSAAADEGAVLSLIAAFEVDMRALIGG
jgi:hypothetical protein